MNESYTYIYASTVISACLAFFSERASQRMAALGKRLEVSGTSLVPDTYDAATQLLAAGAYGTEPKLGFDESPEAVRCRKLLVLARISSTGLLLITGEDAEIIGPFAEQAAATF